MQFYYKKIFKNYNSNIIVIKTDFIIEINKYTHYNQIKIKFFEYSISKLIYLLYKIRLNIIFVIKLYKKYNANLKKAINKQ